ncbi:MAG: hypothetical protein IPK33_25755 [Gemmatimonadetes bacterium]|nr:hypothetical protein [Gemmatimonadota bacterium]
MTSGIDWFDLGASSISRGGVSATLPELLAALRRGDRTVKLSDDSLGMLSGEWLEKSGFLAAAGTMVGGNLRFSAKQLGVLDVLLSALPPADTDSAFEHARQQLLRFEGSTPPGPDGFVGTLRPYQKEGLGWLYFLRDFGFGGCLADDMGLGKTVQTLAFLERRREEHGGRRSWSSRASLVFNWEQEAKRFACSLRILVHGGPDRKRSIAHLEEYDLVITTYGTLRRDVAMLREMEFDYAILDEAQAIKNAGTEGAKAARLIRARHRLAMTGTPIENRLAELWSLLEFLNPGMLGQASGLRLAHSPSRLAGNTEEREEARTLLARAVRPYILRRTKGAGGPRAPERLEQTLVVDLSPKERALYNELRDRHRNSLLGRIDAQGMARSKMHVLEGVVAPAASRLSSGAGRPVAPRRFQQQDRHAAHPRGRGDRRGPQGARLLAVHVAACHCAGANGRAGRALRLPRRRHQGSATGGDRVPGGPGVQGLPRLAQGRRRGAQPHGGRVRLSPGPVVESGGRGAGHRPGAPHRADAARVRAAVDCARHGGRKGAGAAGIKRDLADAIIRADNSVVASLGREELELLLS